MEDLLYARGENFEGFFTAEVFAPGAGVDMVVLASGFFGPPLPTGMRGSCFVCLR